MRMHDGLELVQRVQDRQLKSALANMSDHMLVCINDQIEFV
jgi:hypothetical protein